MARKRKRRKIKKGCARFFLVFLLFIILVVAALTLPFFNINSIKVTGCKELKSEEVITGSGIESGKNIFLSNIGAAKKRLKEIPYVKNADVKMIFPAGVEIIITEENVAGYIVSGKKYVAINGDGKVLEIAEKPKEGIMQIINLKIDSDKAGETIKYQNVNYLDIQKRLMSAIASNGLSDKIKTLDISNSSSIKILLSNSLKVMMGTTAETDYKLKLVKTVIDEGYKDGIFNVSNPEQPTYRKN